MFKSQINTITFIYICILVIVAFIVLFNIFAKKKKSKFHLDFLLLTTAVLCNNLSSGLLPDTNLKINILSQNIIAYTLGFVTIGYFAFYLSKYYNLTFRHYLKFNYTITFLAVNLVVGFIIPYTITNDLILSRKIFLILPITLILFLFYIIHKCRVEHYFGFKNSYERFHALAGLMGIFSIISVPLIMLVLGDSQSIEQTFFTIGYFFICIEYFLYQNIHQVYSYDLTDREAEILNLIINNRNIKYLEIGQLLNISEKTVSAHLSNIYKK